jgi:hypothetical protein
MTGSCLIITLPSRPGPIDPPRPRNPRVRLRIRLTDRKLSVDIATTSLQGAVRRSAHQVATQSRLCCKVTLSTATSSRRLA